MQPIADMPILIVTNSKIGTVNLDNQRKKQSRKQFHQVTKPGHRHSCFRNSIHQENPDHLNACHCTCCIRSNAERLSYQDPPGRITDQNGLNSLQIAIGQVDSKHSQFARLLPCGDEKITAGINIERPCRLLAGRIAELFQHPVFRQDAIAGDTVMTTIGNVNVTARWMDFDIRCAA